MRAKATGVTGYRGVNYGRLYSSCKKHNCTTEIPEASGSSVGIWLDVEPDRHDVPMGFAASGVPTASSRQRGHTHARTKRKGRAFLARISSSSASGEKRLSC